MTARTQEENTPLCNIRQTASPQTGSHRDGDRAPPTPHSLLHYRTPKTTTMLWKLICRMSCSSWRTNRTKPVSTQTTSDQLKKTSIELPIVHEATALGLRP